jgi:putative FmdB family regulatory protein
MPTYGYRCPECGHAYDKLQKISDTTLAKCPECDTPGERVITGGAGLVFKGSGFYITDYKRSGDAKTSSEEPKKESSSTKSKDAAGPKDSSGGKKSGGDS